jgi:hypothetical protein
MEKNRSNKFNSARSYYWIRAEDMMLYSAKGFYTWCSERIELHLFYNHCEVYSFVLDVSVDCGGMITYKSLLSIRFSRATT